MAQTEFRLTLDTSEVQGFIELAQATLTAAKAVNVADDIVRELEDAITKTLRTVRVEPV